MSGADNSQSRRRREGSSSSRREPTPTRLGFVRSLRRQNKTHSGASWSTTANASISFTHRSRNSNLNSQSTGICYLWRDHGECRFGEGCRFRHPPRDESVSSRAASSSSTTSRNSSRSRVRRDRNTSRGNNEDSQPQYSSRYSSFVASPSTSSLSSVNTAASSSSSSFLRTIPEVSPEIKAFIKRIDRIVNSSPTGTISLDNHHNIDLWMSSWSVTSLGGLPSHAPSLLRMYLRLPVKSMYNPQPHIVWSLIHKIILSTNNFIQNNNSTIQNDTVIQNLLSLVHLITDVIVRRLLSRDASVLCSDPIAKVRTLIMHLLQPAMANMHHYEKANKLSQRLFHTMFEASKNVEKCIAKNNNVDGSNQVVTQETDIWSVWKESPTLDWLLNGKWLDAPNLKSSYNSIEQYVDTIRRTMIMLTFYWGAGAIFPNCRTRPSNNSNNNGSNNMPCNQPLLVRIHSNSNHGHEYKCQRKVGSGSRCNNTARWKCYRQGHDMICGQCLRAHQKQLINRPNRHSSTDIYDGTVERESSRREGVVYILKKVESRKPPEKQTNWRTSYRLKCSALVAVVQLSYSGEELTSAHQVYWAEIVPVGVNRFAQKEDHTYKQKGQMAMRFLTKLDIKSLNQRNDVHLHIDSHIAIIDLQVFIPEVIPILSALTDPEIMDHLQNIKFSKHLLANSADHEDDDDYGAIDHNDQQSKSSDSDALEDTSMQARTKIEHLIRKALEETEMDVIIGLGESKKQDLIYEISALVLEHTLDGNQLQAFLGALRSSLHCTQGPPGTGKSYLGAALIKALDAIRKAAARDDVEVGPIIVLSYKNHALDEILLDIVKSTGGGERFSRNSWRSGELIRCGRTEESLLQRFIERNSPQEVVAKEEFERRKQSMRNVKRLIRDLKNLKSAFSDNNRGSIRDWCPTIKKHENNKQMNNGLINITNWLVNLLRLFHAVNINKSRQSQNHGMESEEDEGNININNHHEQLESIALNSFTSFQLLNKLVDTILHDSDNVNTFQKHRNNEHEAIEYYNWSSVGCDDAVILNLIQSLSNGNEHWTNHNIETKLHFLLHAWLDGKNPPPRCVAHGEDENGCIFAVETEGSYCEKLHACRISRFNRQGCSKRRGEHVPFCSDHLCTYGLGQYLGKRQNGQGKEASPKNCCLSPRLKESQVCKDHACTVCTIIKRVPILQRQERGPTCNLHTCQVEGCFNGMFSMNISVCYGHACSICMYFHQKNDMSMVKSAHRILPSLFCQEHKCQFLHIENGQPCEFDKIIDRDVEQDFCRFHACQKCTGKRNHIAAEQPLVPLCDEDRCSFQFNDFTRCDGDRVEGKDALFCPSHTCRICHEKGMPLNQYIIEEYPRNTCELHSLCTNVDVNGMLCNNEVSSASSFMCSIHEHRHMIKQVAKKNDLKTISVRNAKGSSSSEHQNGNVGGIEMQCEGQTKKEKRCKTKGWCDKPPFYCAAHDEQRPESDEESDIDENEEIEIEDEELEDVDVYNKEYSKAVQEGKFYDRKEYKTEGIGDMQNEGEDDEDSGRSFETNDDIESSEGTPSEEDNVHEDHDLHHVHADDIALHYLNAPLEELGQVKVEVQKNDADIEVYDESSSSSSSSSSSEETTNNNHHELCLSSEDGDDVADKVANDVPLDEMEVTIEEEVPVEDEVPENLLHLHEIADQRESESEAESELSEDEDIVNDAQGSKTEMLDRERRKLCDPSQWLWTSTFAERCKLMHSFLDIIISSISELTISGDEHVEEARNELAEVSASSFKTARVIGATVVGATRRLHALRASEPFAMVVEEACEVLEPTLLSVLSVRSLQKLELVGDHRQLPAFVAQYWFNVQMSRPSVKVSLFERLVENKSSPLSILDVQRRMRKEICDLTRIEYEDVVKIQDDNSTVTQRIGDHVMKDVRLNFKDQQLANVERSSWAENGKLVPGVKQQVMFWDIEGSKQGRAAVGLSKCNQHEADACFGLIKWLMRCGVHPSSITLITPYKGQVLTIMRMFRKEDPNREGPLSKIVISTVDRYQGDENDIVILSLVSSQPGNRFVAFGNRFIVSASRARIGFYIVGKAKAVSPCYGGSSYGGGLHGPKHWKRLLEDLQTSPHPGESSRIGTKLKICCPRHREVFKEISKGEEFPSDDDNFCEKQCSHVLSWCGHVCKEKCHSPAFAPHTECCEELVDRPCDMHIDVQLTCNTVQKQAKTRERSNFLGSLSSSGKNNKMRPLDVALPAYECEVLMEYRRPECSHSVELRCDKYKKIVNGLEKLEDCKEKVSDFIHPVCGHVTKKPNCTRRRKYEQKPPTCTVRIQHVRKPCRCVKSMHCFESIAESTLGRAPKCRESVVRPTPRCTHPLSSRCYEATKLAQMWNMQGGDAASGKPIIVRHGIDYGPSEKNLVSEIGYDQYEADKDVMITTSFVDCRVLTKYERSCGHEEMIQCVEAFQLAAGEIPETLYIETIVGRSPICGHDIEAECNLMQMIDTLPQTVFFLNEKEERVAVEEVLTEGNSREIGQLLETARVRKIKGSCNQHVFVIRNCGHKSEKITCTQIYRIIKGELSLPSCKTSVTLHRQDCRH